MRSIRLRESIVPFAVAGTVLLGVPAPAHAGRTVRCESQGRNRQYCRVGIHGQVRLQRQLSRSACIRGRSWGEDGNGIWVSDGCRAEFWIDGIPDYDPAWMHGGGSSNAESYGGTIRCESEGRGRRYCAAYTGNGIHLVRQLSRSECVYQRTWGYDAGGIWVTDGCRAEFASDGGGYGGGYGGGDTVRCESGGHGRSYCRADTRGGVSLARQLSRSACIQGQTWGYDGGGIWVDDGCRGEFRLGYEGHHGDDGHRKRHDNTAAVAAGVLVLGALVAVAASGSKKKEKEREPAATSVENATEETPQEVIACRAAVRQKILDHHGDDTVVRFASGAGRTNGADRIEITGEGTVEAVGRSWAIAYRCVVDAASGQVLEAHVED